MTEKLFTSQICVVLERILHNANTAKSLIEEGKEIYCGRRIDATIDQLTKLMSVIKEVEVVNDLATSGDEAGVTEQ